MIARYTLTPRGEVDGFLLRDGTQVHVPPHFSTQLVYAVGPGDAVAVRGLRALDAPMVAAVSVVNDASGATVTDAGGGAGRLLDVQGQVQATPRGARSEVNGAVLADGTILRLPSREAERFVALLRPGAVVAARGEGWLACSGPWSRPGNSAQASSAARLNQRPALPGGHALSVDARKNHPRHDAWPSELPRPRRAAARHRVGSRIGRPAMAGA